MTSAKITTAGQATFFLACGPLQQEKGLFSCTPMSVACLFLHLSGGSEVGSCVPMKMFFPVVAREAKLPKGTIT